MAQDPTYARFAAIAEQIYGDVVDPRELWELAKNAPDGADVHVEGDAKKKNRLAHAGLAASGVATVGGAHALYLTSRDLKRDIKTPAVRAAEPAVKLGRLRVSPKAAAIGAGAGWLALHTAEMGGDAAGIHAQTKQLRQKQQPPKPKQPVAKGALRRLTDPKPIVRVKPLAQRLTRKPQMTAKQLDEWKKARSAASTNGVRAIVAGTTLGAGGVGVYAGRRHNRKVAEEAEPVEKAFRVKPLNAGDARRVVSLKARRPAMAPPLAKAASELTWSGEICKVDTDKRQVFGWCSLSSVDGKPVVDLQGDYVPLEEIEKSAYTYVIESRKGGDMHKRVSKLDADEPLHTSDLIESFVVTPDKLAGMGLAEDALPHGWWVGFKVNDDEQWAKVKSGERAGFSIHGTGQRSASRIGKSFMPTKAELGTARKITEMGGDTRNILREHLTNQTRLRAERGGARGSLKKPSEAAGRHPKAVEAAQDRFHVKRLKAWEGKGSPKVGAPKQAPKDRNALGPSAVVKPKVRARPAPTLTANRAVSNRTLATIGISAGVAGGAGVAEHQLRKSDDDPHRAVRTAAGTVAGAAGAHAAHEAAGQGLKLRNAAVRRTQWDNSKHRAVWYAHRREHGLGQITGKTPEAVKNKLYRTYPSALPGYKGQRALAHISRPAAKVAIVGTAALAGAAVGFRHKKAKEATVNKSAFGVEHETVEKFALGSVLDMGRDALKGLKSGFGGHGEAGVHGHQPALPGMQKIISKPTAAGVKTGSVARKGALKVKPLVNTPYKAAGVAGGGALALGAGGGYALGHKSDN